MKRPGRGAWAGRVACAACVVAAWAPGPACGWELKLLGGADFFGATQPGSAALAAGELGISLHGELRDLAGRVDLRLDYADRDPIVGDVGARHDLNALYVTVRRLAGRLDLTLGRFPAPGGFWLITDGGDLKLHLGQFALEAFGGLRSYTGGRVATEWNGRILPLAGGAITVENPVVRGALAATWTRDVLDFYRGAPAAIEHTEVPALFVDGQLLILPHPTLMLLGGATLGSRYQVTYSSMTGMFTAPPSVDNQYLSSVMAYLLLDWRPVSRLRIGYGFDFDRVAISTATSPLDNTMAATGSSFLDHTLRASVRLWRALHAEARYRLRWRDSGDLIHRLEGRLDGDNLIVGLGAFVSAGGDLYQASRAAGVKTPQDSLAVTGGLSFVHRYVDLRGGVLYTDAIGAGVGFSTHAKQAMGAGPTTELFPYVLGGQRIAFLRAFATVRGVFAGFDAELNLDATQLRVMAQAGYAR